MDWTLRCGENLINQKIFVKHISPPPPMQNLRVIHIQHLIDSIDSSAKTIQGIEWTISSYIQSGLTFDHVT